AREQRRQDHGRAHERRLAERSGMGGDDRHGGRRDGVVPHVGMKDRAALWLIGAISVGVVLLVAFLLLGHRRDAAIAPTVAALPLLNACLNATSAALLTAGYLFIRDKRVAAHRACMVSALVASRDRKSTRLNSSHDQIS